MNVAEGSLGWRYETHEAD